MGSPLSLFSTRMRIEDVPTRGLGCFAFAWRLLSIVADSKLTCSSTPLQCNLLCNRPDKLSSNRLRKLLGLW
jgi:hypothetical protein